MKAEHNPARYSEMSKSRPSDEVDKSIDAFCNEVKEARIRHKIADVHVILRVLVDRDGDESPALATLHFGAIQESEGMCAYAFARSAEERRRFVDWNKTAGTKSAA